MTLLGRWHFLSNLINNKTYSNKSWYFDSSEIVSLHFYVQNNFKNFKQNINPPHFITFPPLCVVEVVYPLPGVPGQVPVPVPGVELTPKLLPRRHAGPDTFAENY